MLKRDLQVKVIDIKGNCPLYQVGHSYYLRRIYTGCHQIR